MGFLLDTLWKEVFDDNFHEVFDPFSQTAVPFLHLLSRTILREFAKNYKVSLSSLSRRRSLWLLKRRPVGFRQIVFPIGPTMTKNTISRMFPLKNILHFFLLQNFAQNFFRKAYHRRFLGKSQKN